MITGSGVLMAWCSIRHSFESDENIIFLDFGKALRFSNLLISQLGKSMAFIMKKMPLILLARVCLEIG